MGERLQRPLEGGAGGVQLGAVLLEDARGPGARSGLLLGLTGGLGEGLEIRRGSRCRAVEALRSKRFARREECLLVLGHARLERGDLGERKQEGTPRVGLKALLRQRIREGVARLCVRGAGVIPIGACPGQGRRPVRAFIQMCRALIEGGEVGALSLHASHGRSQSGFALLEGGREGGGGLAGAREGIVKAIEARALLREGRLDLGDLGAQSLELRHKLGGPIPLGLESRSGGAGHLVELGDTAHEVLVARLRIPQRGLRAVSRLVQLSDLLARDLPVHGRCWGGVLSGAAHRAGRVLFELACEGRGALCDPQVMAIGGCGVRELGGDRGLAQLVRRSEESRPQQVRLHRGIQSLVDGAQRRRGLG